MPYLLDSYYWDLVAGNKINRIFEKNIAVYYKSEHVKLIKKWAGELKGKKILKTDLYEEAFKEGDFLFWIFRQNAKMFGMDISYKIARRATVHAEGLNIVFKNCITSDIRSCAFKDESFDLIISNSTIDNLITEEASPAIIELRRILKPDGIIILTLDNANNPLYSLGYLIEKYLKTNKYYQAQCYSVKKAKQLVEQNNFTIQDITAIVHIPTPFNKIALLLSRIFGKNADKLIRNFVTVFSKMGNKRTKFFTGWFIALKLKKNDK